MRSAVAASEGKDTAINKAAAIRDWRPIPDISVNGAASPYLAVLAGRVAHRSPGRHWRAPVLPYWGLMQFRLPPQDSGMLSFSEGYSTDWTKMDERGQGLRRAELSRSSEAGPTEPLRPCLAKHQLATR